MDPELLSNLRAARSEVLFRHSLYSNGFARVDGFTLIVEPPWWGFSPDECLEIPLTSAAVLPLVTYGDGRNGAMLVHVLHGNRSNRWEIPSGSVEVSDSDIDATALRELREETGLAIPREDLIPLGYARQIGRGGIQFLALVRLDVEPFRVDDAGRAFFEPFPGTIETEVDMLVVEPIPVFMDARASLLRFSSHPWASIGLRDALEDKAMLAIQAQGWSGGKL